MPERSSGTRPRRAHGAAPKAQAPPLRPPTPLPRPDAGNVSTSALFGGCARRMQGTLRDAESLEASGGEQPPTACATAHRRAPPSRHPAVHFELRRDSNRSVAGGGRSRANDRTSTGTRPHSSRASMMRLAHHVQTSTRGAACGAAPRPPPRFLKGRGAAELLHPDLVLPHSARSLFTQILTCSPASARRLFQHPRLQDDPPRRLKIPSGCPPLNLLRSHHVTAGPCITVPCIPASRPARPPQGVARSRPPIPAPTLAEGLDARPPQAADAPRALRPPQSTHQGSACSST